MLWVTLDSATLGATGKTSFDAFLPASGCSGRRVIAIPSGLLQEFEVKKCVEASCPWRDCKIPALRFQKLRFQILRA